jgi:hypothetical protein
VLQCSWSVSHLEDLHALVLQCSWSVSPHLEDLHAHRRRAAAARPRLSGRRRLLGARRRQRGGEVGPEVGPGEVVRTGRVHREDGEALADARGVGAGRWHRARAKGEGRRAKRLSVRLRRGEGRWAVPVPELRQHTRRQQLLATSTWLKPQASYSSASAPPGATSAGCGDGRGRRRGGRRAAAEPAGGCAALSRGAAAL